MISWLLRFSCKSLLSSPWSSCTVMYSSSTKEPRASSSSSASSRGTAAAAEEVQAVPSPGQSFNNSRASRLEEAEAEAEAEAPGLLLLLGASGWRPFLGGFFSGGQVRTPWLLWSP